MARRVGIGILFMLFVGVSYQVYKLYGQRAKTYLEFEKAAAEWAEYDAENQGLLTDINYFKKPGNLEQEVRAHLNYAAPGEKMIIIIPKKND